MNRNYVSYLVAIAVLTACGDDGSTGPSDTVVALVQTSGDNQSSATGQALANPVVVSATADGDPASGVSIAWSVTTGGGTANPPASTTDVNGLASTMWTLGPTEGGNTMEASVNGAMGSPIVFTATAVSGQLPTQASISVGDNFFDEASVTLAVGGTATWSWAGSFGHNVTFSSGPNSTTQVSGMFARDFPTAGSFDYLCTIHGAAMSGTITVVAP